MHDGDVFDRRFCTRQTARFRKKHVAGIHQQGHPVSESQQVYVVETTELRLQNGLQFRVVAADHEDLGTFSAARQNLTNQVGRTAEPHASGGNEEPFRGHIGSAVEGRRTCHSRLSFRNALAEGPAYRNPERKEPFSSQSLLDTLLDQVFVRDDIIIQIGLPRKGDTRIVRHDEYGFPVQSSCSFQCGQGFGREKMRTDHRVETVVDDVIVQPFRIEFVGHIDRRLERKTGTDRFSHPVHRFEEVPAGGKEINVRYHLRHGRGHEREGVCHFARHPIFLEVFEKCFAGRVVSFAGGTGENQQFHAGEEDEWILCVFSYSSSASRIRRRPSEEIRAALS